MTVRRARATTLLSTSDVQYEDILIMYTVYV